MGSDSDWDAICAHQDEVAAERFGPVAEREDVYTDGEIPAVEDIVECDDADADEPEFSGGERLEVEDIDAGYLCLKGIATPVWPSRFRLIARNGGVWPDVQAPPKDDNADPRWHDPKLPDFRLLWKLAREVGYSVGIHGSLKRDVDLIAAPWTEEAVSPDDLIAHLCRGLNAREAGVREQKPLGRVSCNLQINGWFKLIDLSICPRLPPSPNTVEQPGPISDSASGVGSSDSGGVDLSGDAILLLAPAEAER